MKIMFILLIFFVITSSCGNLKQLDEQKEESAKQEEVIIKDSKMEENYIFNLEIIDNRMPSSSPRKLMYAIVSLSPKSDKLENNWKIANFEINGISYSKFDDSKFKGKDLLIYRNNVREIPNDLESPLSAKVKLENDKGETLTYNVNGFEPTKIH